MKITIDEKLSDNHKAAYDELLWDLRRMYQNSQALADNGIPFRNRIESFMREISEPQNHQLLEYKSMQSELLRLRSIIDGLWCEKVNDTAIGSSCDRCQICKAKQAKEDV